MEVSVQELPDTRAEEPEVDLAGTASRQPMSAGKWPLRPCVPYLPFVLCAAIYMLPFLRVVWKATDEGSLVYGAVRIVHGQVFARDFFEVMGPGTFYWLAAFFKLFGVTFLAERICLFVASLGTALAMYFLSRRVCGKYAILPPVILAGVYFSTVWPMVNHHVDSNFFGLLSVVCIVLWHDTRRNILLLAAGALAAVTTCILQPKGMLLLIAFLVWLCVEHRRRSVSWSTVGIVLASYGCVIAAVACYFWSRGALRDLIFMNFIWPSQHYGAVNAVPYAMGISRVWTHWISPIHGVRWFLPLGVVLILPFLFIAALPVLALTLSIPGGKQNLRPEILLYWLCAWAFWISEIHRKDIAHLVSGSALLIILCIHFLVEYRSKLASAALQVLAISACALATVNLFIILCAHSVPTRVGSVGMFKPDPVLAFLDTHVAPGTEIFAYPYCPMYYFLSGTTNPTRYSLLIYNYNTPSQFQEVVRVLNRNKVKYVVWDTSFQKKAAEAVFSAAMYHPVGGFLMEPYLESHYRVVKNFDGTLIMERKAEGSAQDR